MIAFFGAGAFLREKKLFFICGQIVRRKTTIVKAVANAAIISIGEIDISVPGITPARRNRVSEWAKLKLSKIIRAEPISNKIIAVFLISVIFSNVNI